MLKRETQNVEGPLKRQESQKTEIAQGEAEIAPRKAEIAQETTQEVAQGVID